MHSTRYLIIGGGLSGDAACRGIRDTDPDGPIVLVTEEAHPPYARPPLSKGLWKGDDESTIWCGTADLGVDVRLGRRVVGLDLKEREALDDRGDTYVYERLLIATGGRPRRLPFGGEQVVYFRTLDDYRRLKQRAVGGARFCVIGGGFIGSEIAAALAMNGCEVTLVFPQPGIGSRMFPSDLSAALVDYYRDRGVEVLAGSSVTAIEADGRATRISLEGGRVLGSDEVVAGIGIEPNVELAARVGLRVSDGILVDELGRAFGREDVFATGDVARFRAMALAKEMRVEHEDHAKSHGRIVGANMAGAGEPYRHLPFFYSDLFDLGYEAVGELDSRLDTLAEWKGLDTEATIYYLDDDHRPRGVLLWNTFGKIDAARELIRAGAPITSPAVIS